MKYALFNDEGFPTAFYSEDVHGSLTRPVYGEAPEPTEDNPNPLPPIIGSEPNPDCMIPADTVEISDDQWFEFLENQGRRRFVDGQIIAYEPPPGPIPVPSIISRRQFFQGLATVGTITKPEALAAIKTGAIPAALQVILDSMTDEDAQFEADMLLSGATEFQREHPLVMVLAITQGMSESEVDDFWRMCAGL